MEHWVRNQTKRLGPIIYAGNRVFCPICNRTYRKFRSAGRGLHRRENAVCYTCKARERDRLVHRFLCQRHAELSCPGLNLLHIAPDPSLSHMLDELASGGRITADLVRRDVNVRLDICQLPFSNASFRAIYCSHVLQDLPDDECALKEMFRVLKDDGWALVLVPLHGRTSHEWETKGLHASKFDAPGTVRSYGSDIEDKFANNGFCVERITVDQLFTEMESIFCMLDDETVGGVYLLTKPN